MQLLLLFLSLLVLAGAVLFLAIEFYAIFVGQWYGAPFVPSKKDKIATMLALAAIKPGETVVDLGSGNGALVMAAAHQGARAVGIEINPFLVWYSRWKIKRAGLAETAWIIRQDFRRYPLFDADALFLYLWPSTVESIKEKLLGELKSGTRIVSHAFPLLYLNHTAKENSVFLYKL